MGDGEGEYIFPVRSVFNRNTSNFSQSTASSASHADSREASTARGEDDGDHEMSLASDEKNVSKESIPEGNEDKDEDEHAPTQHPNSPTTNHANFDRRKAENEKVSSSVGQPRTAPRGIDRNVHLNDPNQPLPEDEELKTQQSSSSPSSGANDTGGPTKEEEEMRERDYVADKMEEMGDSNSSESKSDESGTRVSLVQFYH